MEGIERGCEKGPVQVITKCRRLLGLRCELSPILGVHGEQVLPQKEAAGKRGLHRASWNVASLLGAEPDCEPFFN